MSGFAYGCCVGSWDRFMQYALPGNFIRDREPRLVFATSGHSGIVPAYNGIIDALQHRDVDGLILLHDDLEIVDPDAEEKFRAAFADPDVAVAGVAGGGADTIAWWEHSPVGHQLTDVMTIDFGQHTGEVDYLEGSIMVLSPWAIKNLRFDQHFTGFHGYEEICVQARLAGMKVVVVDVDTHHHTQMGFKSQESAASWRSASQIYGQKWFG